MAETIVSDTGQKGVRTSKSYMLKELIDKFYLDREKDHNRDQVKFYISEAGKCPRAIFFSFMKAPREPLEAYRLRIFDHGDYIHRMTLKPLFSLGVVRATEVDIPSQEIVAGRADAIISIKGEPYVLDIKSINGPGFSRLIDVKPDHYWQVQLYLHYFKIKKGIVLYVNKDDQRLKEFIFDYDPNLVARLLKNFEILKKKLKMGIVPDRIPEYPQHWQCRFCQFREICNLAGGGEVKWEDLKQKIEDIENETKKAQ